MMKPWYALNWNMKSNNSTISEPRKIKHRKALNSIADNSIAYEVSYDLAMMRNNDMVTEKTWCNNSNSTPFGWSFITIDINFLNCWRCPLRALWDIRWTTQKQPSTIRCRVVSIKMVVAPYPAATFFTIWWCRRPIQLYAIMPTMWQPFRLELDIPSRWRWWKACICMPERLMRTQRPVPASCIWSMWPCGHTTKRPHLAISFLRMSLLAFNPWNTNQRPCHLNYLM